MCKCHNSIQSIKYLSHSSAVPQHTSITHQKHRHTIKANAISNIAFDCTSYFASNITFHSQCFGLLGVNGAGKSTTFKILNGETPPSSGYTVIRTPQGYEPEFVICLFSSILTVYLPFPQSSDKVSQYQSSALAAMTTRHFS